MDHFPDVIVQMNPSLLRSNGLVSLTNAAMEQETASQCGDNSSSHFGRNKDPSNTGCHFSTNVKMTSGSGCSLDTTTRSVKCSSSVDSITQLACEISGTHIGGRYVDTISGSNGNTSLENSLEQVATTPTNNSDAHTPTNESNDTKVAVCM